MQRTSARPALARSRGFTLIELLVVIVIVVVLGSLIMAGVSRRFDPDYDPSVYMDPAERAFYLEQKRANDIRERELELQYRNSQPAPVPQQ